MNIPVTIAERKNTGGDTSFDYYVESNLDYNLVFLLSEDNISSAQEKAATEEELIALDSYSYLVDEGLSIQANFAFAVPFDGLVSIIKKWDKYLFVYIPLNPKDFFISTSSDPAFKRAHGNAIIIDAGITETEKVNYIIREILRAWLWSDSADFIFDGSKYIISREQVNSIKALTDQDAKRQLIAETSYGATHKDGSFNPDMFLPDKHFFLPVKAKSYDKPEMIIPLIHFDFSMTLINIRIGYADIPFDPVLGSRANQMIESKWTWFEANKVIECIGTDKQPSALYAWYPMDSLSPNRIKKVECGKLIVLNPKQETALPTQIAKSFLVSHKVIFINNRDDFKIFSDISSTNWKYRNLKFNRNSENLDFTGNWLNQPQGRILSILKNSSQGSPEGGSIVINASVSPENFYFFIYKSNVLDVERLRNDLVEICKNEYKFWHEEHPNAKETDSGEIRQRLGQYWVKGVEKPESELGRDFSNLGDSTFQDDLPWSAAFICWCMRESLEMQKANDIRVFKYGNAHITYVRWAKENRAYNLRGKAFWLYDLSGEVKIEPGDILVKNRKYTIKVIENGKEIKKEMWSNNTYTHLNDVHTHTDIVMEVLNDRLILIGGNVKDNVDKRIVFLDTSGKIDPAKLYKVGAAYIDSTPEIGSSTNENSQSKFFAIIKLRQPNI